MSGPERNIEHPRHTILEEMRERGWDDTELMRGMDVETGLASLLYIHVASAEQIPAGSGVLSAIERRLGVSDGFLQRMDDMYRATLRELQSNGDFVENKMIGG